MFKNRFLFVIGLVSLLLVTMAVATPRSQASLAADQGASDFYQRHPDWTWAINDQNVVVPVTGDSAFPDYYQRHLELSAPAVVGLGASDYFQRHPELVAPAAASVDLTDYYFRQQVLFPAGKTIDLTDYYFRYPELTSK
jgi:hypothetical protein